MLSFGGALPAGSYQVELLDNGAVVTTIPFRIGEVLEKVFCFSRRPPSAGRGPTGSAAAERCFPAPRYEASDHIPFRSLRFPPTPISE